VARAIRAKRPGTSTMIAKGNIDGIDVGRGALPVSPSGTLTDHEICLDLPCIAVSGYSRIPCDETNDVIGSM
jgi:hypothetical protein